MGKGLGDRPKLTLVTASPVELTQPVPGPGLAKFFELLRTGIAPQQLTPWFDLSPLYIGTVFAGQVRAALEEGNYRLWDPNQRGVSSETRLAAEVVYQARGFCHPSVDIKPVPRVARDDTRRYPALTQESVPGRAMILVRTGFLVPAGDRVLFQHNSGYLHPERLPVRSFWRDSQPSR